MGEKFYFEKTCVAVGIFAIGLFDWGKFWESRQNPVELEQARVVSVRHSEYISDLSSSQCYLVRVEGEEKQIYFSENKWDPSIQTGDSARFVFRKTSPLNPFLDGVSAERKDISRTD